MNGKEQRQVNGAALFYFALQFLNDKNPVNKAYSSAAAATNLL